MSDVTREEFDELKRQVAENTSRLYKGDTALALIDKELKTISDQLSKLSMGVQALQEKPAKKWESISSSVLQWVVTALLAYIAVRVGLA